MKKLLAFLIMLLAAAALFAVPAAGEPGVQSAMNTEGITAISAGVSAAVTDVSPVIAPVENLCFFSGAATNDFVMAEAQKTLIAGRLFRQEAKPFSGYSRTRVVKARECTMIQTG